MLAERGATSQGTDELAAKHRRRASGSPQPRSSLDDPQHDVELDARSMDQEKTA